MKIASNIYEMIIREITSIFIKKDFIKKFSTSSEPEIQQIVNLVKKKPKLVLFPYSELEKYSSYNVTVEKDKSNGLFYTIYKGKKMYLSKKFKLKLHAKRYIRNLIMEQDSSSPHRYLTPQFNVVSGDIVYDIGAAEGIFALDVIETAKKIYLFECNPGWVEALQYTFAPYKDKIEIINKYVSDNNNDNNITIDYFTEQLNESSTVNFIKMDIEGYEEPALKGAAHTLSTQTNLKLATCIYHLPHQQEHISKLLSSFENTTSDGYMIYYYDYNIKEDYLRHGILRSTKKSN